MKSMLVYKGYTIEVIRGKMTRDGYETLAIAIKDGKQLTSRASYSKLAVDTIKSKIDAIQE